MKSKIVLGLLFLATVCMCIGCGKKENTKEKTLIGVSIPDHSSERWISDGYNLKDSLEKMGYAVELQFAEEDPQIQVEQLRLMIENGAKCLIVASVDSTKLTDVLQEAKNKGIKIIAYDRLLMGTNAVDYYIGFDNEKIGELIGNYIVEAKDLKSAKQNGTSYSFELFMGSPDDNNIKIMYNGIMKILEPYIQDNTLFCRSGEKTFEAANIPNGDAQTAAERLNTLLAEHYSDKKMDIIISAFDEYSYSFGDVLEQAGYELNKDWPLMVGQEADITGIQNIIKGRQSMTVFKNSQTLAEKCANMVHAVLNDTVPELNDTKTYNNGQKVVKAYLCEPQVVDRDNYKKVLIDSNYYSEDKLGLE